MAAEVQATLGVAMDSKKIKQVRWLIAGGFYTDPEVLDSIEQVLVDRHFEKLLCAMEKCDKVNQDSCDEKAVGVHAQIVDDLMQYPLRDSDRYHDLMVDVVAGSLRKLVDLVSMHKAVRLPAK